MSEQERRASMRSDPVTTPADGFAEDAAVLDRLTEELFEKARREGWDRLSDGD